jgi:hypothetical protein
VSDWARGNTDAPSADKGGSVALRLMRMTTIFSLSISMMIDVSFALLQ